MLNEKQLKKATKWYNDIMYDICREHNTIGTNYILAIVIILGLSIDWVGLMGI